MWYFRPNDAPAATRVHRQRVDLNEGGFFVFILFLLLPLVVFVVVVSALAPGLLRI